jgi:DnaJ-class molecular chaperone
MSLQVKAAFRARAKDLHPDLSSGDSKELHDSFVAITEAYDVLKDAARRYQYDAARSAIPRQTPTKGPTAPYDTRSDARQQAPFGDSEEAFDAAFKRWWERGGAKYVASACACHSRCPST